MTEHKHAAVLRAIADGKAVQWQSGDYGGNWLDFYQGGMITPLTHARHEWRIKPEPKPDVVRYVNLYDKEACVGTFRQGGVDEELFGTIKCTVDGETGKLKSAEVLP